MKKIVYWSLSIIFLAVCVFYMINNAYWTISDEAIVISYTGFGKPFSFLGFDGMIELYGRLYPFAYTLYNVLLLFFDGYVPAWAVYVLQSVALVIFAMAFSFLSIHILKGKSDIWRYLIAFCIMMICVFRVYPEFVTCYTGVWIVFFGLSLFLLSFCKFFDTENWGWAILAIVSINYITYCYETVFTIPFTIGVSTLLFNYKNLSWGKKLFSWLLVGSGFLFVLLYIILVIPHAGGFYHHQYQTSIFGNALRMFVANKIYWLALIVLIIRLIGFVKQKTKYSICDSLLLAAFAYFGGASVLRLDYTYYYNIGALVALVAVLYLLKEWIRIQFICVVMVFFVALYGRSFPKRIDQNQKYRIRTNIAVTTLTQYYENGESLYWYAPEYDDTTSFWVSSRVSQRIRLECYLHWLLKKDVEIIKETDFVSEKKGVWLFPRENTELFPEDLTETGMSDIIISIAGINGYIVK